jgi:serine/threonine protein kinase/WD40 repeat protein
MSDILATAHDDDPLGPVVESFLARFRRGERPALTELIALHPELSGEIRELIPALVKLEKLGGGTGGSGDPPQDPLRSDRSRDEGTSPERLGDYLILRHVGGGGMGVVYEAEHESLKSRVALKVVHPRFRADPKYLRRFHAEARVAAGLHHTNIVSVFDYGDHDGVCYYAMQFIQGQPLDHVLADLRRIRDDGTQADFVLNPDAILTSPAASGSCRPSAAIEGLLTGRFATATPAGLTALATEPIGARDSAASRRAGTVAEGPAPTEPPTGEPPSLGSSSLSELSELRYFREIARVGAQVADALEYAHRRGVLHRDIKPSNLLLDALGNVWVTDFGLAKLEEGDDLSQSREVVGTLRYMAPERLRGNSNRRGDIYSLGATLYELLVFRPPFEDSDQFRLIERIRNDSPTPLRQLERAIPRDLETIVLKALAKDPKDRFGSAGDLASELRRFVEGRPIRSRPVSIAEQVWRWCKREPWLAGASMAAASLITILAFVSTVAAVLSHRQAVALSNQALALSAERARSDRASLDARWRAVDAYTAQARAGKFSRRPGQRFDSVEAVSQAAKLLDGLPPGPEIATRREALRDLAIACMALPDLKPVGRKISLPSAVRETTFDSRFTRYAFHFRDGRISVRNVTDDHEIALFRAKYDPDMWFFRLSPDGRYLATSQSPANGLTVRDVQARKVALTVPGPVFLAARFSPDSRKIAVLADGGVLDFDLATGQPVRRYSGNADCVAFRPDGAQIAIVDNKSTPPVCRIFERETGRSIRTIPLRCGADDVAWSPDGKTVAVCSRDQKIDLWDAATTNQTGMLQGYLGGHLSAVFHPSGTLLASNDYGNHLRLWDPILARPILDIDSSCPPQFSDDGRIVIAQGGQLTIAEVDPALEYRTFTAPSREGTDYGVGSVRIDGRLLAVGTKQGAVLWDLARGTELAFLSIGYSCHLMFDHSGDLITSGPTGVKRWPIHLDVKHCEFAIGTSRPLRLPAGFCGIDVDRTGTLVASANHDYAYISSPLGTRRVGPLNDCRDVAVSPDGQWLATGQHNTSHGAQVWRVSDLTKVTELPIEHGTAVVFSPDGKWLLTQASPCRLWEVGTWSEVWQIVADGGCFSPDGRMIVVQDAGRVIHLVETQTGRSVARLESPDLCRVKPTFIPDGSMLVVTTDDGPTVHVWDLRAIRRRLVRMGLDWDAPPYSDVDPAAPSAPPIRQIEVIDFDHAIASGAVAAREGRWDEAAAAYARAFRNGTSNFPVHWFERAILNVAVNDRPNYRSTCKHMLDIYLRTRQREWLEFAAHAFVLAPVGASETAQALRLAEDRAAVYPDAFSEHVLGLALYKAGRCREAIDRLVKIDALNPDWRGVILDRLVIAMAEQRLGRSDEAQRSLKETEKWIAGAVRDRPGGLDRGVPENWPWRDGIILRMLLDEARGVITASLRNLPDAVFAP